MFTYKSYQFIVVSCYISPENSTWGRDSELFYSHLVQFIYGVDVSDIIICGDLNSRIGNLSDIIDDFDQLPERLVIDKHINQHGRSLIEFLQESRFCVLNGRINPENNAYTCVTSRGSSCVDCFLIPQHSFRLFQNFDVISCNSVVEDFNLYSLISERSKLPDHSILSIDFMFNDSKNVNTLSSKRRSVNEFTTIRYDYRCIPNEFMNNENINSDIYALYDTVENIVDPVPYIDSYIECFNNIVKREINTHLPIIKSKHIKSQRKNVKFWNDNLSILWAKMRSAEKDFRKRQNQQEKQCLWNINREAQRNFDSTFRFLKRQHDRYQMREIDNFICTSPVDFWNKINNLGPKKSSIIPMEILTENGLVIRDTNSVLLTWKNDFQGLFRLNSENNFDDIFLETCKAYVTFYEEKMCSPIFKSPENLNKNISFDELKIQIMTAKSGKACGPDSIPYEVLKNDNTIKLLCSLIQLFFDSGKIPELWSRAIISPIPKSSQVDPKVPLNYRGISLLCNSAKVYSGLLNKRLLSFLEQNNKLADEQNGFHSGRSCLDHVFSLTTIVKNMLSRKQDVFAAFVDFRKAFDLINKQLLLTKLIQYDITGKMYFAIKSMLMTNKSCVKVNNLFTEYFYVENSVRQGDSISSTLFAIYINDLVTEINLHKLGIDIDGYNLAVLLYADDLVLFTVSEKKLQKLIDILYDWTLKWRI